MPDRPLLTFALISYREEKYIREAVEAALVQTYRPLEIILSDDCSPDRTFEIMQSIALQYRGPHTVVLNRNETNLGTGGHINRIMEICHGELIVIAAGDDVSLPGRTDRLFEAWHASGGRVKSLASRRLIIDAESRTVNMLGDSGPADRFMPEQLVEANYMLTGGTHAWSRDVFDVFGPLITPLACEDLVIPFRSALLGDILYLDEPLVKYRRHDTNTWPERGMVEREIFLTVQRPLIFKNWLRDLDTYEALRPAERDRAARLRTRIHQRLAQAEENLSLLSKSWWGRACYLAEKVRKGATIRNVRHQVGVFLAPYVYETVKHFTYRPEKKK